MKILLKDIGKHYNYQWIVKNVNCEFTEGNAYAFLGANGSGKSTLLQIVAGNILPSVGQIEYVETIGKREKIIPSSNIFRFISFASPYMELLEEYTLEESIKFHAKFKKLLPAMDVEKAVEITDLAYSRHKPLKYFSSGMKQRVRLTLAILSHTSVLLLDEPTSNLDQKGVEWYQRLIQTYANGRIIIVCSNHQEQEYDFCNHTLEIEQYKPFV